MDTFYWYDYETTGTSPRVDRITQFAGIRTDANLNVLDEHMLYCKPTHDCLPSPHAVAVTGITPQRSEEHTSELQSQAHLVCRPLREKKK